MYIWNVEMIKTQQTIYSIYYKNAEKKKRFHFRTIDNKKRRWREDFCRMRFIAYQYMWNNN